ncbi:hypothetical protein [Metapseudomonas boanensis]|uniref:Uncharacterized protein n=1 Tax=Metapseudomonas boanensis TaxID=2822138 RepID=A0ABS5XAU4_9GAMM|nr:hypothetical protein [Pseudomonas boanensis]MBT8764808.1 hypothetical protein [Pseudomonas boanensis]
MKRSVLTVCILISTVGIGTVFYMFGMTFKSLVVAVIFVLCPALVLVQTIRGMRQFDSDMTEALKQLQRKNRL